MKKILLGGGAGFIGHNLALLLKKKNNQVTLLDSLKINNIKSKDKKNIYNKKLYNSILNNRLKIIKNNKIKFIEGDARDSKRSMKLFKKINPNIIIHLAAVSHANKSNCKGETLAHIEAKNIIEKEGYLWLPRYIGKGNYDITKVHSWV